MDEEYQQEKKLVQELSDTQSWLLLVVSTVTGIVPALAASYVLIGYRVPVLAWVIPGFIVALTVRFVARPITVKMRLLPSVLLLISMVLMGLFLGLNLLYLGLCVTNFIAVVMFSKRSLTKEQERALWLRDVGKIELN